jgi:hypothetical protein
MPPEAAAKARGVLASINAGERAKRGAQANHGGPDRHAAAVYDKTGKA